MARLYRVVLVWTTVVVLLVVAGIEADVALFSPSLVNRNLANDIIAISRYVESVSTPDDLILVTHPSFAAYLNRPLVIPENEDGRVLDLINYLHNRAARVAVGNDTTPVSAMLGLYDADVLRIQTQIQGQEFRNLLERADFLVLDTFFTSSGLVPDYFGTIDPIVKDMTIVMRDFGDIATVLKVIK